MERFDRTASYFNAGNLVRIVTTGPPKCGTTALRTLVRLHGFKPVPGAIIYGIWKRHARWIEEASSVDKEIVKENIRNMPVEAAWAALEDGMTLHGHIPPPVPIDIPCIVILRDPRVAMVSWFRAKMESKQHIRVWEPDDMVRALFRKWMKKSAQRATNYIRPIYDGWLAEAPRDTLLIVWYEDLFTDKTMQLIADFIGKEPIDWRDLYGSSTKFSGKPTSNVNAWYDNISNKRFNFCWGNSHAKSINGQSRPARIEDAERGVGPSPRY